MQRRIFLKRLGLGAAGVGLVCSSPFRVLSRAAAGSSLPRSSPEAQGVTSEGILAFLDAVAKSKHEFHSVMVLRHGQVVAEGWWHPYRAEAPHMLYSLSKSFTSTAVGFAVTEGKLTVEDRVVDLFPDDLPEKPSEHLAALRIKDLLTMSVGQSQDSLGKLWDHENWVRAFLAVEIKNQPGTTFLYNSGATYPLSAAVQKRTGHSVLDYLKPRLFEPLGIERMSWETCPRGINTGGWGLSVQTEALAKFGQLYLQKGVWQGRPLLPSSWVAEATSFKIQQPAPDLERAKEQSDWHQGYCYQFWRCRHNAFRGDGAYGQFTIVMPDQEAVVVITSESPDMQGELNLVWTHLLPAFKDTTSPANPKLAGELKQRLSTLALLPPEGRLTSPTASRISGKRFKLEPNPFHFETLALRFNKKDCVLTMTEGQTAHQITCGLVAWVEGETKLPGTPPKLTGGGNAGASKIAASGAWNDDNTFEMTWRYYETPHHDTVTCRFEGDRVKLEFLNSLTQLSAAHKETRSALQGVLHA